MSAKNAAEDNFKGGWGQHETLGVRSPSQAGTEGAVQAGLSPFSRLAALAAQAAGSLLEQAFSSELFHTPVSLPLGGPVESTPAQAY